MLPFLLHIIQFSSEGYPLFPASFPVILGDKIAYSAGYSAFSNTCADTHTVVHTLKKIYYMNYVLKTSFTQFSYLKWRAKAVFNVSFSLLYTEDLFIILGHDLPCGFKATMPPQYGQNRTIRMGILKIQFT